MNNKENIINVYIPFIHNNIREKFIEHIFRSYGYGEILSIELREKRKRKNDKLCFLNHKYAFIKMFAFGTIMGNNLKKNIENQFITHVMFQFKNKFQHWEIKAYLSIDDRVQKGFDVYLKKEPSFYNDLHEKKEVLNDYLELEKEINNFNLM